MIADPHEIQRLRYRDGQDLLSRDFNDQVRFEEQLRWWHNRAAHGAFGVRNGLRVKLSGQVVAVERGLAYDCFGRELILPALRTLPIPPAPGDGSDRILVIRYRLSDDVPSPVELAGVCFGGPASQGADLAWIDARRLRAADGVPLARLQYGEAPFLDPGFHPPLARPAARPPVGHGATPTGSTAWESWMVPGVETVTGLEVEIDTRAARFTDTPCYFAWVQGSIPITTPKDVAVHLPLASYLADESPTGFRFRLLVPKLLSGSRQPSSNVLSLARQWLSVCWLGLQEQREGPPIEVKLWESLTKLDS